MSDRGVLYKRLASPNQRWNRSVLYPPLEGMN